MRLVLSLFALVLLTGCATVAQHSKTTDAVDSPRAPSIRGNAIVEFTNGTVVRGRAVIVARDPASLRIELLGPFGHTAWAMVSNGTDVSIYKDSKQTTYAPGDPALPYSFSSRELVSYLLGRAPTTKEYRTVTDSEGRITEATKYVNGAAVLNVTFADYQAVNGRTLPFVISVTETGEPETDRHQSLVVRFTTVEVNPTISEALFDKIARQTEITD
ncbi:MAG: hypothetical protein IME99_10365 [Proteobacteria bacterium]|nr:hypothetical protein [Pseudomonadota bacterium]